MSRYEESDVGSDVGGSEEEAGSEEDELEEEGEEEEEAPQEKGTSSSPVNHLNLHLI